MAKYGKKVRFVCKELPQTELYEGADGAARALLAAHGQKKFVVRPATPVAPAQPPENDAVVSSMLAPAPQAPPPAPGLLQQVNADGTIGTNWTRVAILGAVAAVGLALVLRRRR